MAGTSGSTSFARHDNRVVAVVDLVGSVGLYDRDEVGTVRRWSELTEAFRRAVAVRPGVRLVKSTGDGFILESDDVPDALRSVAEIHELCARANAGVSPDLAFRMRAGVNLSDIYAGNDDIYGRGVNLAARLASVAQPGGTVVSEAVRDRMLPGLDPPIEDIGPVYFKHAIEPVPAYRTIDGPDSLAGVRAAMPAVPPLIPAIAIIPFKGVYVSPIDDAVGELLADLLIARLSAGSTMRVISRLSTSKLRLRSVDRIEMQSVLGSDFVLSGSYRVNDGRVSLVAELANVRHGDSLWVKEYHGTVGDLVSADSEMAGGIVEDIVLEMIRYEMRRVRFQPLPTLEGFSIQLAAIAMMHRTSVDDFVRSREALEHLIERHPTAAEPRTWLAKWYVLRFTRGLVKVDDAEPGRALEHVRRALDGAPQFSLALAMEAFVRMHLLRELEVAEKRLQDAVEANPSEPLAWLFTSVAHQFRGNGKPAIEAAERAISLSPIDPLHHYFDSLASSAAAAAQEPEKAIRLATRSLRLSRLHPPTLRTLAISQVEVGDVEAARATVRQLLELDPGFTIKDYMARAPRGSGGNRNRYARALELAGVPAG